MTGRHQGAVIFATPDTPYRLVAPSPNVGGYVWTIDVPDSVGRVVATGRLDASDGRVGGGTIPHFDILWSRTPRGTVTLTLKRPWEATPHEIVTYEVQ